MVRGKSVKLVLKVEGVEVVQEIEGGTVARSAVGRYVATEAPEGESEEQKGAVGRASLDLVE